MAWRYILYSTPGTGSDGETLLASDLPLTSVTFTNPLSGVGVFSGDVPIETPFIGTDHALNLFRPWSCAVYVDLDGTCMGAYLVTSVTMTDQGLHIEGESFVGYLHGMPHLASDRQFIQTDATDIARWLVQSVQTLDPASNLGIGLVTPDNTKGTLLGLQSATQWTKYMNGTAVTTPPANGTSFRFVPSKDSPDTVLYGYTAAAPISGLGVTGTVLRSTSTNIISWSSGTVSAPTGATVFGYTVTDQLPSNDFFTQKALEPYRFVRGEDLDLGERFDQLAQDGSFDYIESHTWSGNKMLHTLTLTPDAGPSTDRSDLRFVVGENIVASPTLLSDGNEQFTVTIVVGAGDGSTAPWARADRPAITSAPRLSRYKVVKDETVLSNAEAALSAAANAKWGGQLGQVNEIVVRNTPSAPFGSWKPGDWIWVVGSGVGWTGDLEMRVRVMDTKVDIASELATLTVTTTPPTPA